MSGTEESGMFSGLYLHVPFCARKCAYCDFASAATAREDPRMAAYVSSLAFMVRAIGAAGLFDGLATAYVGGGTPTLLGADVLAGLISTVPPVTELTFEANPESFSAELARRAKEAGATRVSLGVQSLNDDELARLGRIHNGARALEALGEARDSGLRVSADLMVAVPGQTPDILRETLVKVLDRGVGHVSVYPLIIEEGTPFYRAVEEGSMEEPSDDDEAAAMEEAEGILGKAGFSRYEVASYCLPGQECRHNMGYWNGTPYLGLGTAAASMVDRGLYERMRGLFRRLPGVGPEAARLRLSCTSSVGDIVTTQGDPAALSFEVEELTAREAAAEDLLLAARTSRGISPELVKWAKTAIGEGPLGETLADLEEKGLLAPNNTQYLTPTERGWLMGNVVYGALWDLAQER